MRLLRITIAVASLGCSSAAATPDAGTTPAPEAGTPATQGYLLFNPTSSKTAYLTDTSGHLLHSWTTTRQPGLGVRLVEGGGLVRAEQVDTKVFGDGGGSGGQITRYDWDGTVTWTIPYVTSTHLQHHDIESLPNGHVLLTAWEKKTSADAIAAGRNPSTIPASGEIWSETIIEIDPTTTAAVVWEWHAWDHVLQPGQVASQHPELIDPTKGSMASEDWLHFNSLRYSPALDQILVSVHNMDEIWIVDHQTGDLKYRWGNPASYGGTGDQVLFGQHCARFIDPGLPGAGGITIFDNGQGRHPSYSNVLEIVPQAGANNPTWSWQAEDSTSFYADQVSSAQRIASGNTVISNGPAGTFFEVDPTGAIQWTFQLASSNGASVSTFQVEHVESNDSRLDGRTLTAGEVVSP